MSDEKEHLSGGPVTEPEPPSPAPSARKTKSVFVYLAVLFAAAFLLLLFAYLMQQRNSQEIMGNLSDLRESMSSFQSLDEVLEENRTLREENDALQTQLDGLNTELENTQAAYESLEDDFNILSREATLMTTLYFAERRFAEEDYAGAAAQLVRYYVTRDLEHEIAQYDASLAQSDPDSPMLTQRYEAMRDFLLEEGFLAWDDSGTDLVTAEPQEE